MEQGCTCPFCRHVDPAIRLGKAMGLVSIDVAIAYAVATDAVNLFLGGGLVFLIHKWHHLRDTTPWM